MVFFSDQQGNAESYAKEKWSASSDRGKRNDLSAEKPNAGPSSERKRQELDESNFEPNYDIQPTSDESMVKSTKTSDHAISARSKLKTDTRKRSRSYSSSSSSSDSNSSDSSSESEERKRKRKRKHKKQKKTKKSKKKKKTKK